MQELRSTAESHMRCAGIVFGLIPGPQKRRPKLPTLSAEWTVFEKGLAPIVMNCFGLAGMEESKVCGRNKKLLGIDAHGAIRAAGLSVLEKAVLHLTVSWIDSSFPFSPRDVQCTSGLLGNPTEVPLGGLHAAGKIIIGTLLDEKGLILAGPWMSKTARKGIDEARMGRRVRDEDGINALPKKRRFALFK